jgi:cysteine-rich repeat protein
VGPGEQCDDGNTTNGDGCSATCQVETCTGFANTTVDAGGTVGRDAAVAIGTNGLPIMSYYDTTNQDLKVAACNDAACSSKTITAVDAAGDVGKCTSIEIGGDGLPLIHYYDTATRKRRKWRFGAVQQPGLVTRTQVGQSVNSCSSTDAHHQRRRQGPLLHRRRGHADQRTLHCSNAACTASTEVIIDSGAHGPGAAPSAALGSDGKVLIATRHALPDDLIANHCTDVSCTAPTVPNLDSAGSVASYTSTAIGGDGLGLISYYDQTNGNLKVAHCSNVNCTSATVSTVDSDANDVGAYASIARGNNGRGIISYYDATAGALKMAWCANTNCTSAGKVVVDDIGDVGQYTSIAVAPTGRAYVTYQDISNGDLKLAMCTSCGDTPSTRAAV